MFFNIMKTTILSLFLVQSFISNAQLWSNEHSKEQWQHFYNRCRENDDCALYPAHDSEMMKRKIHYTPLSMNEESQTFSYFPPLHHHQPKFCSCSHEKRLLDLGPQYFPRYIADMTCLSSGCGNNYVCRPKRFKLWVMRKRLDDEDAGAEPIPMELRAFWVGESIVTTIDCECAL